MPEVHAFRGLRYDLGHVGSLSDVIAPPYDVIDPDQQDDLYEKHPHNVIRLILNRVQDTDDEAENRYSRAAREFRRWQKDGVLQREPDPALYVYHQQFESEGVTYTRHGFMGRVRLQRFGEGNIYPHEETHSAAKADRLRLTKATRTNLSQIFGLYPDPENEVQEILEEAIVNVHPIEATDHLGVVHKLWPVTDVKVISEVTAALGPKPMFVADGHHRYETACNYRDELGVDDNHAANFVLTMCVGMSDSGMIVLPTHRLFRGFPPMASQQVTEKIGPYFDIERQQSGPAHADDVWTQIEAEGNQGQLGLFCPQDKTWVVASLNAQGQTKMAEISTDRSQDWQGLGVSVLHRLVMETLLGLGDLPKPDYVHLVSELIERMPIGDESGQPYGLAALVMPATLEHIRRISEHGERMPAKSTYFYPKLLSGLVFHTLS